MTLEGSTCKSASMLSNSASSTKTRMLMPALLLAYFSRFPFPAADSSAQDRNPRAVKARSMASRKKAWCDVRSMMLIDLICS
jgi:hypothetical protein